VSSAISCIVVKADRYSKKIPSAGEIVQVAGETGLFVVMHVDHDHGIAQLMERTGKHRLVDVPFARLRILNRALPQAVRRFLESRDDIKKMERSARNG
jgi:hypothetical protein